jgi:hypothetical protein
MPQFERSFASFAVEKGTEIYIKKPGSQERKI